MDVNTIAILPSIPYNKYSDANHIFKSVRENAAGNRRGKSGQAQAEMLVVIVRDPTSRGRTNEVLTAVKSTPVSGE